MKHIKIKAGLVKTYKSPLLNTHSDQAPLHCHQLFLWQTLSLGVKDIVYDDPYLWWQSREDEAQTGKIKDWMDMANIYFSTPLKRCNKGAGEEIIVHWCGQATLKWWHQA